MKKELIKIIISLVLYVFSLLVHFENVWINNVIFIFSYIIVGFEVLKEAVEHIFKGKIFDENFLMSIATIGAFIIDEFPEAVAVMLFYQIGELFQGYAVDKSRKSISELMNIKPEYANVLVNEETKKMKPEEVKVGDIIVVKPGEKIPLDGIIIDGNTTIDTKALTGESIPKEVSKDEEILSGTVNLTGVIKIRVTSEFKNSTVSKILDLVENVSSKKSKAENFITKFAKYYTPIVVLIAIVLAVLPPLLFKDETFIKWIYRALSFLVVSCPCALVISIPLSFFGAIGGASKLGILIKGSNYLEAISKADTVVFDKTGTLTQGVFKIQKIKSVGILEEELIKLVAYSEYYSNHPVANSVKEFYNNKIDESKIILHQDIHGQGIMTKIDKDEVLVGNEKLMQNRNIDFSKADEVGTILYVALNNKYVGYINLSDEIKEDSKMLIENLKKNGINKTIMLTGDKEEVAKDVSNKIGIDQFYAELLPDGKVSKLEEILKSKNSNSNVVFVGDGINDAPSLALADVGISMGALGADSAIEASDIVIMTDQPSKIISLIKLSKKTMMIVKQNIVFAIFVKLLVLVLAGLGISTMWEAVFADVGVSVIAVINALRMLNVKKIK